jgi:hypothetical protein
VEKLAISGFDLSFIGVDVLGISDKNDTEDCT